MDVLKIAANLRTLANKLLEQEKLAQERKTVKCAQIAVGALGLLALKRKLGV